MTAKDDSIVFMCVGCNKLMRKTLIKIQPRHLKTHIGSVMKILTNSVSCCGKKFIEMSTWVVRKHLMKHRCQRKKLYSNQKMKRITEAGYNHAKKVWPDFRLQDVSQFHDLYV